MGYLTKYGAFWGLIPVTVGRIHWVSPADSYYIEGRAYSASDNNDGLSPERALRTVAQAMSNAIASANETIALLPGDHTTTASIAWSKAGITMTGIQGGTVNPSSPRTTLTTSATDEVINVTAPGGEFSNICLIPVTTQIGLDISGAAIGFHMHDFSIDVFTPAVSSSTIGVSTNGSTFRVLIERFYAEADGGQGNVIVASGCRNMTISNGRIHHTAGTWGSTILCGAASSGLLIENCNWVSYASGTPLTVGVNGTGATITNGVEVRNCLFGQNVTTPVDNFGAGLCTLVNNYKAGVGATDGGTLITVIT